MEMAEGDDGAVAKRIVGTSIFAERAGAADSRWSSTPGLCPRLERLLDRASVVEGIYEKGCNSRLNEHSGRLLQCSLLWP